MRKTLYLTVVVLALPAAGAARAEEQAATRAVIEKAIQARGGEEKLAQMKAMTFRSKGKLYGMGEGTDYTGEWAIQPPDKIRFQINFEANVMKVTFLFVFDGKQGWLKINDNTIELDEDAVAEAKEDFHAGRVETLVPLLKDKRFELSPLGAGKVGDHETVGVRVTHKGHRDINLFFDKKTGLLLKNERMIKDQMMGGKERTQETLHSDFKDVKGVQQPMKLVIKRDGEKHVEGEITDFQTEDKIDDSVFAKP
jgi:outer membrane lipoprotein-sorting protein